MRKFISLLAALSLLGGLSAPALADEVSSAAPTVTAMEDRPAANIAAEDAAAMVDAGLSGNVAASTAPTAEEAAAAEEAAGVPSQTEPQTTEQQTVQSNSALPFTDVAVSDPYYAHLLYAYEHSLFLGYADNTFRPGEGMTRAMYVAVLSRQAAQLGQDMTVKAPSAFTDISDSNPEFQTAIHWAAERGIVNGKTETTFAPYEQVNRQQACAIIVRYLTEFLGYDLSAYTAMPALSDAALISDYAKEAVAIALNMGLIDRTANGDGTYSFNPWGASASRAVVAKIMAVTTASLPNLKKAETVVPIPVEEPNTNTSTNTNTNTGTSSSSGGRSSGGGGGGGGGGTTPVVTTYTVTFNSNGGSAAAAQTVSAGTSITLPAVTREGYTFAGWSNGSSVLAAGTTYTVQASVTLTAQWTENAPVNPTPVEHTAEEIAEEEKAVDYMRRTVDAFQSIYIQDEEVKACYTILMETVRLAVTAHDAGEFIDRDYVSTHYNDRVARFKEMYNALTEAQKDDFYDNALYLGSMKQLQTVMDYFQVSEDEVNT